MAQINLGSTKIKKIYLGNTQVKKGYVGSSKVFSSGEEFTIPNVQATVSSITETWPRRSSTANGTSFILSGNKAITGTVTQTVSGTWDVSHLPACETYIYLMQTGTDTVIATLASIVIDGGHAAQWSTEKHATVNYDVTGMEGSYYIRSVAWVTIQPSVDGQSVTVRASSGALNVSVE